MEKTLIDAGLTRLQAQVYLFLTSTGQIFPKLLINKLNITRTNAYKVLSSLENLGLVRKITVNNKATFIAEDPIALASLVAEKRNVVLSLEHNVNEAMQQLRSIYNKNSDKNTIISSFGKNSILASYDKQAQQKKPIYFIKSRADIPFMGFEAMDSVRRKQGNLTNHRYGITTDSIEANFNNEIDKSASLTRTWIKENDYTAPVEWSVNENNIVIQVFEGKGMTVIIDNEIIANSFIQLWNLTSEALKNSKNYSNIPIKAKRDK